VVKGLTKQGKWRVKAVHTVTSRERLQPLEYRHSSTDSLPFEVFNLGNSHPAKLSELLCKSGQFTGHEAVLHRQLNQPGDVPLTWADIAKMERLFGYQPATQLDAG